MKKDILIYYDLITSLKTTQEVDRLISEINLLMLTFFQPKNGSIEKALASISMNSAQKIMEIFSKNRLDINDQKTVTDFFETLKELTKKLKVIQLILAFDPSQKTIDRIHNFIKDTIGIGYVLDIEVSKGILGGAIVIFEGKYKDYSLKKSVEDIFKNEAEEIHKLMQ